jgi:ABC-type sugar transport system ATPase subunit
MSDSIIVMHEGTVTARLDRKEANPEVLIRAAMGRNNE